MLIDSANSKIRVGNASKIQGWSKQSIIEDFGQVASTTWLEGFVSGSVIAKTGGTVVPSTHLILSNSYAIACILPLERANSTAIQYLYRTNSNAITLLDRSVRTNSNASVALFRTASNAYAYADRTSSNAIAFFKKISAQPVLGNNLDGTSVVVYQPYHHVFHNAGSARGFVRLNAGFTVLANASVLMDTLETVSGGFDLRETGTLILNNDLYLSGNVTLTEGGNIEGKSSVSGSGNTIFLGGDLTLASATNDRCLHITGDWTNSGTSGDTIIDGQGHSVWIGDRSQIFVDTNVTLTLKNMVIHTSHKSVGSVPAIQLAAHGSTLALDNVIMDLGSDFNFMQGQLFIHDDVLMTGTSAFVYQSPRPSYITSGGNWMFDVGTTFSFAPSAFTDGPYTQDYKSTSTTNNFLIMADATSVLALNGCTLKTTYTGLRLRIGTVLMDNRVQIDTMAGVDINNTTPATSLGTVATGIYPGEVTWSPDGRFVAVVSWNSNNLQINRVTGSGAPVSLGTVATAANPWAVSWSPDGRFIAVGNSVASSLQLYRFTGTGAPVLLATVVASGTSSRGVGWSPDGRFLVMTNYSAPNGVRVFRFTGTGAPVLLGNVATGVGPWGVSWSPDGRFVAVANSASSTLQIYRFMGNGSLVSLGTVVTSSRWVAWSPDGRFIASFSGNTLQVFRFRGSGLPVFLGSVATGSTPYCVDWSPNGRFLAAVNFGSNTLQVFKFSGTGAPTALSGVGTQANPFSVAWSSDGRFITLSNNGSTGGTTLQVFRVNYVSVAESQAMTSSLIFGDSANGSAFDANVVLLGNARVNIKGKVLDASA